MSSATFATGTLDRLFNLYVEQEEGLNREVYLSKKFDSVYGPTHDVMFFIGFVAGQGEDALLSFSL